MEDYQELVERCRKERKSLLIRNSSAAHAKILVENLLKLAQEDAIRAPTEIRFRSRHAEEDFYSPFAEGFLCALESGATLKVLVTDPDTVLAENSFLAAISGHKNAKVEVKRGDYELSKPLHFFLVGESAFRFEAEERSTEAFANFNEPIIGHRLAAQFDRDWGLQSSAS